MEAVMSKKLLSSNDYSKALDAIALNRARKLPAAAIIGAFRAKGYAVSRMAELYQLVAEYQAEQRRTMRP
jgi:anthranilate phosphoribosyltransferase